MSKVKTIYKGDLQTETVHLDSGVKIVTDALQEKGNEKSFSPVDLFAASFAACALSIVGYAAQRHGFHIEGAIAEADTIKGNLPRRVTEVVLTFTFPHNNYSTKERRIIEASIKDCPVGNSLDPDLKVTKTIQYKE